MAPSLLAADFSRLEEEIRAVEEGGADALHLDVMDGHFVENITFGPFIVEAISRLTDLPLITHLMISDPGKYAERFVKAGSSVVTFHFEALKNGHSELAGRIRALGCRAGIALNPDTPLDAVRGLLGEIDLLLAMTVFPGFGGQKFMSEVTSKILEASRIKKDRGLDLLLEVDGGIKSSTAPMAREAGSQILVAGTAVFGSEDYRVAIESIRG
ncbi:MAG TPA: ribulose-phosphate 3-epimerase [Candidatus Krumholzibacterium sp.]|nr:ribulose-phosphate 3-epimerase [Candidatus Krumholzibacterium sp.]